MMLPQELYKIHFLEKLPLYIVSLYERKLLKEMTTDEEKPL